LKEGVSPTELVPEKYRKQLSVRIEEAWPVDQRIPTSPWMTAAKGVSASVKNAIGKAEYKAHLGANTGGANAVYWAEIIREVSAKEVLIRNLLEKSKKRVDVIERTVEKDLLYPLIRWRDVARWVATPSCYLLLAQDAQEQTGIDEKTFKKEYKKTHDYLSYFKETLVERAAYKRYCQGTPFYTMYDIGPYTLGEHKVIWRRMDAAISAVVVGKVQDKFLGSKVCIPQETCVLIECGSDDEAHYLCALLNSAVVDFIAQSYNVRGGKGFGSPNLLEFVKIGKFVSADPFHRELATLSRECHKLARQNETKKLHRTENTIDQRAAKLWGITDDELKAIQEALAETRKSRRRTAEDEEDG
jgi:hypothetical protein